MFFSIFEKQNDTNYKRITWSWYIFLVMRAVYALTAGNLANANWGHDKRKNVTDKLNFKGPVIICRLSGGRGLENFGLNTWNLADPPLIVITLKWSPLITIDNFRDPHPMSAIVQADLSGPPWIVQNFQWSPPFMLSVTTDPPFLFSQKSSDPPKSSYYFKNGLG